MKPYWICILLLAAGVGAACADTVVLKSGAVITGEIIAEDAFEVRVVVSRTQSGHIQTLKIIEQASVESLQRDAPQVAVEPDPPVASKPSPEAPAVTAPAPAPALADLAEMRVALKRADSLTSGGQYDDAVRIYRAVIEATERQRDARHDAPATTTDQGATLELLRLRNETYALLLIALNGRLDLKRTAADGAEESAQQLVRDIGRHSKELDDLRRDAEKEADAAKVHRLGKGNDEPASVTRMRELQDRMATLEIRLQTQRKRAASERLGIVSQESEIQVAREKARQAGAQYGEAQRASRVRH